MTLEAVPLAPLQGVRRSFQDVPPAGTRQYTAELVDAQGRYLRADTMVPAFMQKATGLDDQAFSQLIVTQQDDLLREQQARGDAPLAVEIIAELTQQVRGAIAAQQQAQAELGQARQRIAHAEGQIGHMAERLLALDPSAMAPKADAQE
ncbi:hypothetical protein [Pseudomonas sp. KCJK9000]|uniref:hypothetical protein n=1 Tax=Pseudomonas sp. KCJK9000 TaxID=3344566 RepID=UPI00390578C4